MSDNLWLDHVAILRCPVTREPLRIVSDAELVALNGQIASGAKRHADGSAIQEPLADTALVNTAGSHFYRVEQDIAWLLPILAIVDVASAVAGQFTAESDVVRGFYNEFGWAHNEDGYNDAVMFTSMHDTARQYSARCNDRVLAELGTGKYLLDAASGPVPGPAYTMLSKGYQKRICVDFSHAALFEAKRNIGDHGLFLLGDLTNLPLADGVVDDAMSLHTIYHIPTALQATAVDELVRVVSPGGKAVVVYEWKTAPLMTVAAYTSMGLGWVKQRIAGRPQREAAYGDVIDAAPALYFAPQDRRWFASWQKKYDAKLKLFSMANARFASAFFKDSAIGRLAAKTTFAAEKVLEPITARFGQYPMFVITKR